MPLLFKSIVEWHVRCASIRFVLSASVCACRYKKTTVPGVDAIRGMENLNCVYVNRIVIRGVALTWTLFYCRKGVGCRLHAPLSQCRSLDGVSEFHTKSGAWKAEECEGDKSRERASRLQTEWLSRAKKVCFNRRRDRLEERTLKANSWSGEMALNCVFLSCQCKSFVCEMYLEICSYDGKGWLRCWTP